MSRMPDFIVIGTMKSATTTLFRWLSAVPGVELPTTKEPGFFADERVWARGPDWYQRLFADVPDSATTGEASVIYSDPEYAPRAAERIAAVLPDVRLVCVLRDPAARLRSHYRHQVQRNRESRPFLEAIADPETAYVRRSEYHSALGPYFDRFDIAQVLVVSMEETVMPPFSGWYGVLSHLGLTATAPEGGRANVTSEKRRFSKVALRLWEWGLLDRAVRYSPQWSRHVGQRFLLQDTTGYRDLLASAEAPLPDAVLDRLQREVDLLETALGRSLGFQPT